jgi:hypothetical protein
MSRRQFKQNRIMLRPLGLALRSASANGCGGVIKAEEKSRPIGGVKPVD